MKKILFLLLSTVAMYGQVPADATPLENIQITNNVTDNSATKVNVQSTGGTINTISKSDLVNVVEVNDVLSLPLTGVADKIYVVKNVNKIYRWDGTFYPELAGSDISGLQAQIDLKANNSDVVKLTGNQSITGQKTFNNSSTGSGIVSSNNSTGRGIVSQNSSTGSGIVSQNSSTGDGIVSNQGSSGTGFNYVGQNTGTNTFTVNKLGVTTATSFINSTAPANNILLAGGGDLAQGTAFNKNFGTTEGTVVEGGTLGSNAYSSTAYLPLSGGTLTGIVTAPTATAGTNTTQIATTAFVLANASVTPNATTSVKGIVKLAGDLGGTADLPTVPALATKANLASPSLTGTPTAPTAPAGTNTTQIATTAFVAGGLATKENAFSKNTAFNKNFGTTAGTVVEGGTLGSNAYTSTAYLPLTGGTINTNNETINYKVSSNNGALYNSWFDFNNNRISYLGFGGGTQSNATFFVASENGGNIALTTTGVGKVVVPSLSGTGTRAVVADADGILSTDSTVYAPLASPLLTGTPTAPTAPAGTNTTQIATTAFVLANSKPYKVYTALLTQSGTNAPVATVLENTLGGTVVWTRTSAGVYYATLAGSFTINKTFVSSSNRYIGFTPIYRLDSNIISLATSVTGSTYVDNVLENNSIEIRVYN